MMRILRKSPEIKIWTNLISVLLLIGFLSTVSTPFYGTINPSFIPTRPASNPTAPETYKDLSEGIQVVHREFYTPIGLYALPDFQRRLHSFAARDETRVLSAPANLWPADSSEPRTWQQTEIQSARNSGSKKEAPVETARTLAPATSHTKARDVSNTPAGVTKSSKSLVQEPGISPAELNNLRYTLNGTSRFDGSMIALQISDNTLQVTGLVPSRVVQAQLQDWLAARVSVPVNLNDLQVIPHLVSHYTSLIPAGSDLTSAHQKELYEQLIFYAPSLSPFTLSTTVQRQSLSVTGEVQSLRARANLYTLASFIPGIDHIDIHVSIAYSREDIREHMGKILDWFQTTLDGSALAYNVEEGTVVLSGIVSDYADRWFLKNLIMTVPGVHFISDGLLVPIDLAPISLSNLQDTPSHYYGEVTWTPPHISSRGPENPLTMHGIILEDIPWVGAAGKNLLAKDNASYKPDRYQLIRRLKWDPENSTLHAFSNALHNIGVHHDREVM